MTNDPVFVPPFVYRADVAAALAELGVQPTPSTPPPLLRAYLNDLYRYELRRLRDRLVAGAFPKREYAGRVLALRERYFLLSVPMPGWLARGLGAPDDPKRGRDA